MACSKLEARGHLLHKTGTPPKHFSRECTNKNSGFVTRCDEYEPNFCFNLTHSMDLPSSSNNEVEYFFEFSFHPPIITTPLPVGEVTIDAWLNLKGNLGPIECLRDYRVHFEKVY